MNRTTDGVPLVGLTLITATVAARQAGIQCRSPIWRLRTRSIRLSSGGEAGLRGKADRLRQRCPRVRSTAGCPGAFESGIPSRLAKGLESERTAFAYQSPTPAERDPEPLPRFKWCPSLRRTPWPSPVWPTVAGRCSGVVGHGNLCSLAGHVVGGHAAGGRAKGVAATSD